MPSNVSYTYGTSKALATNTYTNIGKTFVGWSKNPEANNTVHYVPGEYVTDVSETNDAVVILYAVWTTNTYTVTLDHQGGSGGTASIHPTYGAAMPVPTPPTLIGHTFVGYYTGPNGTGTQYYNSQMNPYAPAWTSTTINILYAWWTSNTYTIAYNANGGSGTTSSSSHTYGVSKALTTNAFTRTGYRFGGWATTTNGAAVYINEPQSVINLTAT